MKLFVVAAIIGLCAADRLDNKYLPPRGNAGAGYSSGGFGQAPSGAGIKSAGGFGSGGFGGSGFGGGAGFGAGAGAGTQYSGNAYNAAPQQYGGQSFGGSQFGGRSNADANAQILRSNSEVTADGFSYDFETSNGIRADASGVATNGVQSQGSFAYKGDDGQEYSITYTADENGYQPQGAHLPTPPPIPEAILKSLEQNARDEAAGISDDGQYRGEGAGAGGYPSAGGYSGAGAAGGYSGAGAAGGYSGGAPSNQYGAPAPSGGFGGASGKFGGASAGYGGARGSSGSFGASSGGFGSRPSSFGATATSKQYIPPAAGRASGNGNFNAQSGYRY